MADDISNKTLALLVGLAIMVSLVGIFSVQQGGITGAQVANVTTQTGTTNFSLATVVSIILDDNTIQFGTGFINSSIGNNATLDSFAATTVGGGDFVVGNSTTSQADSIHIRNQGSVDFALEVQSNSSADQFVNASGSHFLFYVLNQSEVGTAPGIGTTTGLYSGVASDTAGACATGATNGTIFGDGNFSSENQSHQLCPDLQFESDRNEMDFFVQVKVPETASSGDKTAVLTFTAIG